MSGLKRRCGTCRYFQDAGMGGTGWCTHPKRQVSSDVRILVRSAELACRNAWGVDFWEAADGEATVAEPDTPSTPGQSIPDQAPASFEDEVTSVVNADMHHAQSGRDDRDDNDIIVEQSIREPEDDADDDRFDLLAHGGRDSVSKARNRMLRRRQPTNQDETADDEPARDEREPMDFAPNDFVEEEGPAPAASADDTARDAVVDEDVIISENAPQRSPRSRRIRRARGQSPDPKGETSQETEVERSEPEQPRASAEPTVDDRDPFNTVPTISTEIDLSRLMREPAEPQQDAARDPQPAQPVNEGRDSYELALKRAQAIKAAARAERETRQREQQRPITPLRTEPRSSEPQPRPEPARERSRISTRDWAPEHRMEAQEEAPAEPVFEDHPTEPATVRPERPRRDDARRSWWRGMFQNRIEEDRRAAESAAAEAPAPAPYAGLDDEIYDDSPDWMPAGEDSQDLNDLDTWASEPDDQTDDWVYADAREPDIEPTPTYHQEPARPAAAPFDLSDERGMSSYRERLFASDAPERPRRSPSPRRERRYETGVDPDPRDGAPMRARRDDAGMDRPAPARPRLKDNHPPRQETRQRARRQAIDPADLLDDPADAWYEPEPEPEFDVRELVSRRMELLDMTIEIAPEVPRACATCRSYRQSDNGERGWCTNNWAFTHRQMVNAGDLACQSTIGCWWLPADEEVWLDTSEPDHAPTPRVDRLVAHLDPLKEAVGR